MASTCSDEAVLAGLFLAAYDGKIAEVKSLLKINALSADVSDPVKGSTALQWACTGGSLEVVEWLVKEGGAKVGHRNKDERTAFFFACEHCHKPVAEFLVRQAGVDVNAKDGPSGHSPLHRACIAGQTREKAGAMDLIAWLLTSAKANAEATDLGGRKPGEADLAKEASSLKPTAIAANISGALTEARTGKSRGATPTKPIPTATAAPAVASSPTPAAARSGRPTTTLAAARAAAAAKSASSPRAGSPVTSPVKTGSHFGVPSPVINSSPPAKTASPARTPSPAKVADPAWAASPQSPRGISSPGPSSPSRVAARAAALAEKTGGVSTASPSSAAAPVPTSPSAAMAAMALDPSAPVSSVTVGAAPPPAQSSPPSPQRAAERATLSASSPRSAEASHSPWSTKPRAGGVHPRAGGGLPVTANSAQPGSPAAATAAAAAAVTSATTAPAPVGGAGAKEPAYRLRSASGSRAAAAPASTPAVDPSSAPVTRYQRPGATSTGTAAAGTGSATGSAAAVIGASHGPKASALAAAFENKARERDTTTAAPTRQIRRGNSGLNTSGKAVKSPALSSTWGGAANGGGGGGGGGGRPATKVPPKRTTPPQVPHVAATAARVTPESILGKGSVMHRKQVYVAAAQKGGNAPTSPKAKAAPFLGKDSKPKDGSFMDKFVSMFSISPQSSPANSPPRSSSRSPRTKQRTPNSVNGSDKSIGSPKPAAEPARMGFFNTNMSFKMPNATEKE